MTNSMPTSNHHVAAVCFQCESFGVSGPGTSLVRSAVEADAANPHRAGVAHDIWSRPMRAVTGIMPPENTSCDMTATTSNGMICSLDLATADRASPSMADATHVSATSANSSRPGLPNATAPWVGAPFPSTAMMLTIADWTIAKTVYTQTLASR